ncbi:uncharacterized protein LOC119683516 [Teleopsis dalmanni]|uniref:uncharacterized protein LOC119683516 n=1 Tax=Teleopsis dalmanni TaxID=139649 RepID=UPI0018CD10DD|nr:uncharacterized protein LOC119683516 [Teleopsis dalmanni]
MPSKKKKYNARFPAGRIKKIMQSDEEIGKVAQAVPVIISRTLELFVESLLRKTLKITNSRNAKTLSTSHMKQCIMSEQRFDFLRELVKNIPDINIAEESANYNEDETHSSPEEAYPDSDTPFDLSMPSTSTQATRNSAANGITHKYATRNGGFRINTNMNTINEANHTYLKREYDIEHQHQLYEGVDRGSNSVITHTTKIANINSECSPVKIFRSDSTPAGTTSQKPRQRLKHQPQSLPYAMDCHNTTTLKNQPNKDKVLSQPPAAIPAPIVNFDFCNKPVVKIDYSNISMPGQVSSSPLSVTTNASNPDINFANEAVINIDLSNIVRNASDKTIESDEPMATIRIGAFPAAESELTSSSKSSMASFKNSIDTTTNTAKNKNSFFELDEDYDNI